MSMSRGRPGTGEVKKSEAFGPVGNDELLRNASAGACIMDSEFGNESDKAVSSDNGTTWQGSGAETPNGVDYNSWWGGKSKKGGK